MPEPNPTCLHALVFGLHAASPGRVADKGMP